MSTHVSPSWPAAEAWPAPPPWPAPRRRTVSRTGRVVALLFAVVFLMPGLGGLAGGGILLWADWFHRSDGFVVSPHDDFSSPGYALVLSLIHI